MLKWLDLLAAWWLNWRTDQAARNDPLIQELGIQKVQYDESGFHLIASFPAVTTLADEAAALLGANEAENYVQFDMMPRVDRGKRPIRVTVQWADGESPASKAARLEKELEAMKVARQSDE
jgi:hypothetical protein